MDLSKLAQLRSKTNRQLIAIIDHQLDAAREFVARGHYTDAENAYQEARVLIPLVDSLPHVERRRLESRLEWLGEALEQHTATTNRPRAQAVACL